MSPTTPMNYVKLVGVLKEAPFCPGRFPLAILRMTVPAGVDKNKQPKQANIAVSCNGDIAREVDSLCAGDRVIIEGMITNYYNKRDEQWTLQVRASRAECFVRGSKSEEDLPNISDETDELPF